MMSKMNISEETEMRRGWEEAMLDNGTFEGKDLNQGYRRGKGGLLSFLFSQFH
jgi:hypothetical protein